MDKIRRSIMEETRKNLQEEYNSVRTSLNLHAEFSKIAFELLEKQVQKLSIRGPFVRMIYDYIVCQAKLEDVDIQQFDDRLFHVQIPFILEGVICVHYYENQILDGKGGVLKGDQTNLQKIRYNLLASHYLKDFLYDYVTKSVFPTHWSRREALYDSLRKMFQFVDLGQYAEQRWSSLKNFREGFPELPKMSEEVEGFIDHQLINEFWGKIKSGGVYSEKEQFVRFYLQRIYLTGAAMFVLATEFVMNLLGYQGVERERLKKFAGHYGMMCQMVNDNNDFLPAEFGQATVAKNPEDAFSDLYNENITLPMFFFFSENSNETSEDLMKLSGMEISNRFESALKQSIPLTEEIAHDLDNYLNHENQIAKPLKNLSTIALKTRYQTDFKRIHQ